MEREAEFYTTRAIVSPRAGSQTQLRQEDTADLLENSGMAIREAMKGNTGTAAHRFIRGLFGKAADKIPQDQAEEMLRMLFTNDPETNRQIVRALSFQQSLGSSDVAAGIVALQGARQAQSR